MYRYRQNWDEFVEQPSYVPLSTRRLPFDADQIIGTWAINTPLPGDIEACINELTDALCGQLFDFAGDSSGSVNGLAFTWSLGAEGEVVIDFDYNQGSIVLAKLRDHGGSVIEVIAKAEA